MAKLPKLNKNGYSLAEFIKTDLPVLSSRRKLGAITQEMEPLLFELVDDHGLQAHEVLGLVLGWITAHYPSAIEEYDDKTLTPKLKGIKYGPVKKKR